MFVFECPQCVWPMWSLFFFPLLFLESVLFPHLSCVRVPKDVTDLAADAIYNVKQLVYRFQRLLYCTFTESYDVPEIYIPQ